MPAAILQCCVISVDMGTVRGKWRPQARSTRRSRRSAGGAALIVLGTLLSACGTGSSPQTTAGAYLADWARQDWAGMRQLAADPPGDFVPVNTVSFTNLEVQKASFTAGAIKTSGATASEPVTEHLTLAGVGTITIGSALRLVQRSGRWLVDWSPATIAPPLRTGDRLVLQTTWPARAPILGAGGAALTTEAQQVTVGVEGSLIKKAASLSAALVKAGATAQQANGAIAAAKAQPTYFEPVFTVPRARYEQLSGEHRGRRLRPGDRRRFPPGIHVKGDHLYRAHRPWADAFVRGQLPADRDGRGRGVPQRRG
jgi:hypothetical protein